MVTKIDLAQSGGGALLIAPLFKEYGPIFLAAVFGGFWALSEMENVTGRKAAAVIAASVSFSMICTKAATLMVTAYLPNPPPYEVLAPAVAGILAWRMRLIGHLMGRWSKSHE